MRGDGNPVPLLAVEDLAIEFRTRSGTVRAVDGIGFELRRGETVALVGESGSGKSVTAYAIMGILDAAARITSGQIVFGGLELLQAGEKAVAEIRGRELAIIFQARAPRSTRSGRSASRSPTSCCGTAMSPLRKRPGVPLKSWRKCAFPIRSGAPDPIHSSCRAACASGS